MKFKVTIEFDVESDEYHKGPDADEDTVKELVYDILKGEADIPYETLEITVDRITTVSPRNP